MLEGEQGRVLVQDLASHPGMVAPSMQGTSVPILVGRDVPRLGPDVPRVAWPLLARASRKIVM